MSVYEEKALTPVQTIDGLNFKRDDLYAPFGKGVNGGKLRQCMMLLASIKNTHKAVITYCSIHSPQAPITAASARACGLECCVLYGGTTPSAINSLPMPRLAEKYGARIKIAARSGRHAVLHAKAKKLAAEDCFIVQYGINLSAHGDVLLGAVAAQVENIPDVENLVLTCGSGITAAGVFIGLNQYHKNVKNVHLVATAPDRQAFIHGLLKDADRQFFYHDLYGSPGFVYEKGVQCSWGGLKLHPHYEAKTMQWFKGSGIDPARTLFWIVGAEPR